MTFYTDRKFPILHLVKSFTVDALDAGGVLEP